MTVNHCSQCHSMPQLIESHPIKAGSAAMLHSPTQHRRSDLKLSTRAMGWWLPPKHARNEQRPHREKTPQETHRHIVREGVSRSVSEILLHHVYMYIFVYVCVCVCVNIVNVYILIHKHCFQNTFTQLYAYSTMDIYEYLDYTRLYIIVYKL